MRLKDKVAIIVGAGQQPGETIGNGRAVSARFSSLMSTSSRRAPSCAKRTETARPLPMVSPGCWPAPTMMATLSFRRIGFLL